MMIRIAHEVSHSWFGLVICALDWTEEWLSEGFATFVEDYIHQRAMDNLARRWRLFHASSLTAQTSAQVKTYLN